jgi:serine/threonine protein phosphatase PrpC
MRAALWGRDHEELDRIASASAGERAGLAISRGRFPKAYRYEDPNEDVVAVVAGPRATLLVCADGHTGLTASHVAVEAVLDALAPGDDPPGDFADGDWLEVFTRANDAIIATKHVTSPHPASDTVLLAALVTPDRLTFAGIGDAALVVARPGTERGRQLNKEAFRFLGEPMKPRQLKSAVQRGSIGLEGDEWVAMATDGLSEFVAPLKPADVVPRVLARDESTSAEAAAVQLVETACTAGAGDNVATIVVAP